MAELANPDRGFRLAGWVNSRGEEPAICVPAFSHYGDNQAYVQYIGLDDTILHFERFEDNAWETIEAYRGKIKRTDIDIGSPAVYWVALGNGEPSSLFGVRENICSGLIANKWRIDKIANPFERLEFAQLADYKGWYLEEAARCEATFTLIVEVVEWLEKVLLMSRIRYAVDAIAVSKSLPRSVRRMLGLHTRMKLADGLPVSLDASSRKLQPALTETDVARVNRFFQEDLACRYASSRLGVIKGREPVTGQSDLLQSIVPNPASSNVQPGTRAVDAQWSKRMSASDAQRKPSGNERGGITLVKADHDIDPQTHFRRRFFSTAEWTSGKTRTGEPLETALIRFDVDFLGQGLGTLSIPITYARNREAKQNNYTSLMHLGPLAPYFESYDMTGKWVSIRRYTDGTYSLSFLHARP